MKSFATLIDEVQDSLNDDGTKFTDAFVTPKLERALREISDHRPYVVMETFKIESRTGTETAGTANKLTDDSNDQFLATDVGKVVYNITDKTWAVVTAYDDAETLSISKDIMDDGEEYVLFNKGCHSNKQINIEDITDYVGPNHGVLEVSYPTQQDPRDKRNFTIEGDILTLDIWFEPDDSADTDANVEVYVWFQKRHRVSQLTDLAGAVDSGSTGYAAGVKSMTVDTITTGEIIAEGQLFTVDILSSVTEKIRGIYRVTAAVTIASSEAIVKFYPGLESAVGEDAVVTFIGSTLTSDLEMIVVELAAGRSLIAKAPNYVDEIKVGRSVSDRYEAEGQRMVASALMKLRSGLPPKMSRLYSKTKN